MKFTRLGNSGLRVSRITLGCMSFGEKGKSAPWALKESDSAEIFEKAVELGINFWDTANVYGGGSSETIVGNAVRKYSRREDIVLATKVFGPMHGGPGGSGLSRKAIMEQVDASLRRLGTDYVDLYQIHRFDPNTPVEETMGALHDVVKAGKVRYIGASSMWAWQFSKMQYVAELNHLTKFVSMQNQYSLLMREDERELYPLLEDQGVGAIPWSPLAAGKLARPWDDSPSLRSESAPTTDRSGVALYRDNDRAITDAVQQVAASHNVSMAQIALAWVLAKKVVVSPIVGPTKPQHLVDAVESLELSLESNEFDSLESHYESRKPTWFS